MELFEAKLCSELALRYGYHFACMSKGFLNTLVVTQSNLNVFFNIHFEFVWEIYNTLKQSELDTRSYNHSHTHLCALVHTVAYGKPVFLFGRNNEPTSYCDTHSRNPAVIFSKFVGVVDARTRVVSLA